MRSAPSARGETNYGWVLSVDEARLILAFRRPTQVTDTVHTSGCNVCRAGERLDRNIPMVKSELDAIGVVYEEQGSVVPACRYNFHICPDCEERILPVPKPRARWHRAERVIEL